MCDSNFKIEWITLSEGFINAMSSIVGEVLQMHVRCICTMTFPKKIIRRFPNKIFRRTGNYDDLHPHPRIKLRLLNELKKELY